MQPQRAGARARFPVHLLRDGDLALPPASRPQGAAVGTMWNRSSCRQQAPAY